MLMQSVTESWTHGADPTVCLLSEAELKRMRERGVNNVMKELIRNEDKNKPYSDQKLSSLLKERGIEISRRAVAKYREELGIRGSFDRKAV